MCVCVYVQTYIHSYTQILNEKVCMCNNLLSIDVINCRVTDGPLLFKANDLCQKVRQLNGDGKYASQMKMCNSDDHEIVQKVVDGSKLALSECQYQFRYRPWNCTNRYRSISKTLQRGVKIVTAKIYFIRFPDKVYCM